MEGQYWFGWGKPTKFALKKSDIGCCEAHEIRVSLASLFELSFSSKCPISNTQQGDTFSLFELKGRNPEPMKCEEQVAIMDVRQ